MGEAEVTPAARKAAILEEMGMEERNIQIRLAVALIESHQAEIASDKSNRDGLGNLMEASKYAIGRLECVKHEIKQLEDAPPPPKEPRYRRKPLEWVPGGTERYEILSADTPFGSRRIGRLDIATLWECDIGDPCTLEEAKSRVEAEITRRLESVLEVCDE